MKPFDESYWKENYASPDTMDCIGNAKEHTEYLYSFFQLEQVDISSVIDLGAGYGHLFQKVLKRFLPYKAQAIEPSPFAYERLTKRKIKPVESTQLKIFQEDLKSWCERKESSRLRFDLALCTSVFQYLDKEELEFIIPIIAKRVKYLYLTVPTDKELKRQVLELDFDDQYALKRSRQFYRKILKKDFTNISHKIWESKFYFSEDTTLFTDLLYRS